ncbi:hypothetical protein AWV80_06735 [Cupriavidus sp. UYMU48A]|nr:hypothetical protein AWV80_06735 [Cupriavidus sp. UYMU48A]
MVLHLLRATTISGAMCVAVWVLSIGDAVTHSSAVSASVFFSIVAALFGVYLAFIYGASLLRHLRSSPKETSAPCAPLAGRSPSICTEEV